MKNAAFLIVMLFALIPGARAASGYFPAGHVEYVRGDVSVLHGTEERPLELNQVVFVTDIITTGENGRVKLGMQDGSSLYIGRTSRISVEDFRMQKHALISGLFHMLWGKIKFAVSKLQQRESSFTVKTALATIGVRGTVFTVVVPKPGSMPDKLSARQSESMPLPKAPVKVLLQEGKIVLRSFMNEEHVIKPGFMAELTTDGEMHVQPFSDSDLDAVRIDLPAVPESGAAPQESESYSGVTEDSAAQHEVAPAVPVISQTSQPDDPHVPANIVPPVSPHVPAIVGPPAMPNVPANVGLPPVARGIRSLPVH